MANIDNILEQKNRQLQNLEDELITLEKKLKHCQYEQEALKEKKHEMMLLEAGKVIEKAGLLGQFDEDALYVMLLMNNNSLLKKG